ncbi:transketolase [Boudabousia tangfeifanii]|uniref:Transketolase n=1 Tax=Boudabousia tangfeifanii TaxID=1912795 RepID=A0A1D9MKB0_9ACTO|nr:transketolase [Boudabousia tangfeifanii]AOZ72600.1 transketolase [Boudabousia tangfeifanii]
MSFAWNEGDDKAIAQLKALAADAVENAGSGHPGTAISLAPAAYLLFRDYLKLDPKDPKWLGRDKFVLSIGHASLIQYSQLFWHGLGLELDDLKSFRHFGSRTPGHPEVDVTDFVEVNTGPLGSGIASAVGMAMASRRLRGMLDPQASGDSVFDQRVWVFMGDGDMQEGLSHEACSLAGAQQLGNLIAIYDDNHISIEDDTEITFTEDVDARFEAYGWNVEHVSWLLADGSYEENVAAFDEAIKRALQVTDRPSMIRLRTIIGWPSPNKQNTGGIHGAKLGAEELAGLKQALGMNPEESFVVDEDLLAESRRAFAQRNGAERESWDQRFVKWENENPTEAALLQRLLAKQLPQGWEDNLPVFAPGKLATRAASGQVINALAPILPELWGGSADLAGSNNTLMKNESSFFPAEHSTKAFTGNKYGRNLHFGIREHAMGAILNGIALTGLFLPYGGTFMVFSDYMRGAIRLAALMELPVTYVFTHDSIGVGEDGPTHQPVEHLAALRAIPNLEVVRPADANETAQAWAKALSDRKPTVLALSRQDLPVWDRENEGLANADNVRYGAYVLRDSETKAEVALLATGSEVALALDAQQALAKEGIAARVISVPCMEWFQAQSEEYQQSVLPDEMSARVVIEAGIAMPWYELVGNHASFVTMSSFGTPGGADTLFKHFGFTVENVVAKAKEVLAK